MIVIQSWAMADEQQPRKKKKKHNPVLDWLLYAAVRVLVVFLYLFDVETNLRFACFLGDLLWKFYGRGRQRALENLRASFPDKSEEWIVQTGRRSFQQLIMLTIDILFTPRLVRKHNWRQYSRFRNTEQAEVDDAGAQGPALGHRALQQLRDHRLHDGPVRLRHLRHRPAVG